MDDNKLDELRQNSWSYPTKVDVDVKDAIINSKTDLTSEEKTSVQNWMGFVTLTQAEYDALATKDESIFYFIVG